MKRHGAEYCSIVIATVGRESLLPLINSLLKHLSAIDFRVYVVLPTSTEAKIWRSKLESRCVQILAAGVRNQVSQRAFGFRHCAGRIVIQLDDDLVLDSECIPTMVQMLNATGQGNIIGATRKDFIQSISPERDYSRRIMGGYIWYRARDCYAFIFGGAVWGSDRWGSVTRRVAAYAMQWESGRGDLVATDWLAGGCVACFHEDLIIEEFYPFGGKAYFEDFIHSHLRRSKGLKHWVAQGSLFQHLESGRQRSFGESVLEAYRRVQVAAFLGLSPCGAAFYSIAELCKEIIVRAVMLGYRLVRG